MCSFILDSTIRTGSNHYNTANNIHPLNVAREFAFRDTDDARLTHSTCFSKEPEARWI